MEPCLERRARQAEPAVDRGVNDPREEEITVTESYRAIAADDRDGRIMGHRVIGRLMALALSAMLLLAACSPGAPSNAPASDATVSDAPATPAASGSETACGSSVPSDITAEIRFLTGPFSDEEQAAQEAIAAKFNEKFPNVTFTFELFDWYTSRTSVQTSLAEGAHDIYYMGEGDVVFYSADDTALLDIGPYTDDPCYAEERAQINGIDRILGMSPYPVAVPYLWFPENALYVNMDKVREAGLDSTFLESWQSFADAAVAMSDPAAGEYGIGLSLHNYVEWYGRLKSAGADWVTADGSAPGVDTPEAIQVTKDMVDLFTRKAAAPLGTYDYTTGIDAFAGGKLGMVGYDASVAGALTRNEVPFEWELHAWPPGPQSRATVLNTSSFAIGKKTPNPDLAWEVLKHWTSAEVNAEYAGKYGYFPSHQGALEGELGATFESLIPPQMTAARDELIEHGVYMLEIPEAPDMNARATPQIERAYAGEISAEEAIQNIVSIVNEVMGF